MVVRRGTCSDFYQLDVTHLAFTLPPEQCAIFVDEYSREIVTVVLRNFAQIYVTARLPRMDSKEFSLPITDPPITFIDYPLAPPEGYMSVNFAKHIH